MNRTLMNAEGREPLSTETHTPDSEETTANHMRNATRPNCGRTITSPLKLLTTVLLPNTRQLIFQNPQEPLRRTGNTIQPPPNGADLNYTANPSSSFPWLPWTQTISRGTLSRFSPPLHLLLPLGLSLSLFGSAVSVARG